MQADKGEKGGIHHRAVNIKPIRVGTVEHHQRDICFRTGFHHIGERRQVGVTTHANILQVEHHDVDIAQIGRIGLLLLAIKRNYRQSGGS